ncbi:MAG: hypothetical protein LBQ46_12765, partial [Treponema sp.]|nr:hypothetical protein [Treponema sp.]
LFKYPVFDVQVARIYCSSISVLMFKCSVFIVQVWPKYAKESQHQAPLCACEPKVRCAFAVKNFWRYVITL